MPLGLQDELCDVGCRVIHFLLLSFRGIIINKLLKKINGARIRVK